MGQEAVRRIGQLYEIEREIHGMAAEERRRVLDTLNDPRFADLTPAQIVALLAEERVYVGSESIFYRIK